MADTHEMKPISTHVYQPWSIFLQNTQNSAHWTLTSYTTYLQGVNKDLKA